MGGSENKLRIIIQIVIYEYMYDILAFLYEGGRFTMIKTAIKLQITILCGLLWKISVIRSTLSGVARGVLWVLEHPPSNMDILIIPRC